VPFVLVFFFMYMPPVGELSWLNAAYAAVLLPLYFILYGIIFTPYLALIPELTADLKERVDLTTSQSVFMVIGTFTFAAIGVALDQVGWVVTIGGVGVLLALFFIPVATQIREKPQERAPGHEGVGYFTSFWLTLNNGPFRYVVASTAIYWFALNGIIALVPHWTKGYLGGTEADVTKLMAPFLLMNVVFFFVFNALSAKFGKHVLMLVTFLGSGVVLAGLCFVGHLPWGTPFMQSAFVVSLFGIPVAGFMVLPFAVLGDVVDYDERLTGRRREAIFFGVQGIFQKLMIGVSVFTFTRVAYLRAGPERAPTEFGMKLMALLCAAAAVIAFLVFLRYPLREREGKIMIAD